MRYDPAKHHRRSIRLAEYDYSLAGAYFVTICAYERECLFGEMVDGEMRPNRAGSLVLTAWEELPGRFPGVELDEFAIMPNHVHGIIVIVQGAGIGGVPCGVQAASRGAASSAPTEPGDVVRAHTLGEIMRAFKSVAALYVNRESMRSGSLWQRNYWERIIRDEAELCRIREYMETNPARWADDRENPNGGRLRQTEIGQDAGNRFPQGCPWR